MNMLLGLEKSELNSTPLLNHTHIVPALMHTQVLGRAKQSIAKRKMHKILH